MTQHTNQTYLLVGTVTKDLLPNDRFTTGGTVTYAGAVVKRLGWHPVIITAAAPDFIPACLFGWRRLAYFALAGHNYFPQRLYPAGPATNGWAHRPLHRPGRYSGRLSKYLSGSPLSP